jgi:hypothetical protein
MVSIKVYINNLTDLRYVKRLTPLHYALQMMRAAAAKRGDGATQDGRLAMKVQERVGVPSGLSGISSVETTKTLCRKSWPRPCPYLCQAEPTQLS